SRPINDHFQQLACYMLEGDCSSYLPDTAAVKPVPTNSLKGYILSAPTSTMVGCGAAATLFVIAFTWMVIGKKWAWAAADGMIIRVPGLAVTVFRPTSVLLVEWFGPSDVLENIRDGSVLDIGEGDDNGGLLLHSSVPTFGRRRLNEELLLPDGPNLDLLESSDGDPAPGAFGNVRFFNRKTTGEMMALKTAKGIAEGTRNICSEIDFLREVTYADRRHIVTVVEARTTPTPMLLMRKEPTTLRCIGDSRRHANPAEIVKVLGGILTAVEFLNSVGFLHRDIKPENILVSKDGEGILTDFGLCVQNEKAVLPSYIGAGTANYSAKEVVTTGSCLCSELFSVSVCFLELMLSRNPFDGKALLSASEGRRAYLQRVGEEQLNIARYLVQGVNAWVALPDDETDIRAAERQAYTLALEEAYARLKGIRSTEWSLGVRNGQWQPNAVARSALDSMVVPLTLYVKPSETDTRTREDREGAASAEAKNFPPKVFEAADWTAWLPGTTRAPCTRGLREVVSFVLERGMIDANPSRRPQSTAVLRTLLDEALRVYQVIEAEGGGFEQ
ncbi:unnamed protein product, partial [Ectocarpus fasciculatus]